MTRISTPHVKRSLLVGETIVSGIHARGTDIDGVVYLATPQDVLFHIVPLLKKHTTHQSLPLQDIVDLLPPPVSLCAPLTLLKSICDCTPSSNSLVPDTYKLSTFCVLQILIKKVDALIPVLGASIVAEFVDKPLALVIGQEEPENIAEIQSLARRKCAMDIISSNLDDELTQLLHGTTKYTPSVIAN
jgi:Ydr279p protein family (RNase H2 complex component) wHTH domain